jgi:hypothetical protein
LSDLNSFSDNFITHHVFSTLVYNRYIANHARVMS